MQYSTCQHLEHSSTVQHPDGKTLRCDSDDWPVPVVLADRFALLSCVNCRRHRRHNCIVCPLPPHQLTNWSFVQRPTFITPLSPVLQAALCLAPLLSASAPPLTPFAAATAAAATTADLLSSVTLPPFPAGRTLPGSAAERFSTTQKQQAGGSPGHTPFPTKAKVRAAAAAAGRTAAGTGAASAASKVPSHKKEMALAAAHRCDHCSCHLPVCITVLT
jgi:hypothetical protein